MKKKLFAVALFGAATMLSAPSFAEDVYFPIIAKGFSHQFWQAVKAGAESAAKANNVTITFEGPNTEAEIDDVLDILTEVIERLRVDADLDAAQRRNLAFHAAHDAGGLLDGFRASILELEQNNVGEHV